MSSGFSIKFFFFLILTTLPEEMITQFKTQKRGKTGEKLKFTEFL